MTPHKAAHKNKMRVRMNNDNKQDSFVQYRENGHYNFFYDKYSGSDDEQFSHNHARTVVQRSATGFSRKKYFWIKFDLK